MIGGGTTAGGATGAQMAFTSNSRCSIKNPIVAGPPGVNAVVTAVPHGGVLDTVILLLLLLLSLPLLPADMVVNRSQIMLT